MNLTGGQLHGFLTRLQDRVFPDGMNADGEPVTVCCDGRTQTQARDVLAGMGAPQRVAGAFLKHCEELGGYCDCEILLNAAPEMLKELEPTL